MLDNVGGGGFPKHFFGEVEVATNMFLLYHTFCFHKGKNTQLLEVKTHTIELLLKSQQIHNCREP